MEPSLARQLTALVPTTKNKETKRYIYIYKRHTEKPALGNKTNLAPVWYDFYELQPGNAVGPNITTSEPTWALPK